MKNLALGLAMLMSVLGTTTMSATEKKNEMANDHRGRNQRTEVAVVRHGNLRYSDYRACDCKTCRDALKRIEKQRKQEEKKLKKLNKDNCKCPACEQQRRQLEHRNPHMPH